MRTVNIFSQIKKLNQTENMKKIVYIDMDNVLVGFGSGIDRLSDEIKKEYENRLDDVPGIFSLMNPMPGAVEAVNKLAVHYNNLRLKTRYLFSGRLYEIVNNL